MCGLAGIVLAQGLADSSTLACVQAMSESLAHRGPDGSGVAALGPAALGHRRLAVIDLSQEAAQPMRSGQVLLSYNGEVYNHLALREELEQGGARFRSASDTEVVLEAWKQWGPGLLSRLNGMYALAIWDEERGQLFLARDPYGQKPLYYRARAEGGLSFASELRAFAHDGEAKLELDRRSLAKFLVYDSFPGRGTVYAGVKKLLPGESLLWEAGQVRIQRPPPRRYGHARLSPAAAEAELWRLLVQSLERRLMSDVPLGVFLSGGLDSSALLAAAAEVTEVSRLQTFAIGFHERSFDESGAAARVARHFGVRHRVQTLDEERLLRRVPEILDHLDEPLADVSVVPTYALSRFAREHVTVALGGDGGDELFAGYDTVLAERAARLCLRTPRLAREALLRAVERLPATHHRRSPRFLVGRFLRGLDPDPLLRNLRWFGSFSPEEAAALVQGGPSVPGLLEDLHTRPLPAGEHAPLELWTDWYLPEQVLTKVDRASMAVSLEVRAPFLDPDLGRFAHSLPYRYKLRGLTRKWLLKRVLRGKLPPEILRKRKQGFGAPNGLWLRGPLRAEMEALLAPERLRAGGILAPDPIARLVSEHLAGTHEHRKKLWNLFVLQRWMVQRGLTP